MWKFAPIRSHNDAIQQISFSVTVMQFFCVYGVLLFVEWSLSKNEKVTSYYLR